MKLYAGNIQNFKEYSQFKSLKQFNNHMEQWLLEYKSKFTKSELIGLKRLIRYSAKHFGVANAKIGTLLKAINILTNGFGISRSSFERMLRKAKEFGILEVKSTVKTKGGKGHNVYVFNKIDVLKERKLTYCKNTEMPRESKVEQHNFKGETINHFKTIKHKKIINKRIGTLDYTLTLEYVPKQFRDLAKCFFNDAQTIEEYWTMAKIIAYKENRDQDNELMIDIAIDAFKQMINKLKKGKLKNPIAYFTGIMKRKYEQIYFQELKGMWEMLTD